MRLSDIKGDSLFKCQLEHINKPLAEVAVPKLPGQAAAPGSSLERSGLSSVCVGCPHRGCDCRGYSGRWSRIAGVQEAESFFPKALFLPGRELPTGLKETF